MCTAHLFPMKFTDAFLSKGQGLSNTINAATIVHETPDGGGGGGEYIDLANNDGNINNRTSAGDDREYLSIGDTRVVQPFGVRATAHINALALAFLCAASEMIAC